jgi:hypothetical protein
MNRDVKGYEGLYFVNEFGEIYSYPKKTRKGVRKMLTHKNKNGYLSIDLCKNGNIKKYSLHRIIALAFLDNIENKEQVNHINGNKHDNRIENLEWSTRSENQKHSIETGLRSAKGEKNSQSKLTEKDVLNIFNDKRTYIQISKDFKISISTISDIKRGHTWNHITNLKYV